MAAGGAGRAAIGVSVHTGWVIAVVAGGSLAEPRLALRRRLELLGDPERFVFHAAAEMMRARARTTVEERTARIQEGARGAVRVAVDAARAAGEGVTTVAIVGSARKMPGDLDSILASHSAIHAAEGVLYADAMVAAATDAGLVAEVMPAADLDRRAMAWLGVGGSTLRERLLVVGKKVGRPWTVDEKNAALAAWIAVASAEASPTPQRLVAGRPSRSATREGR